jgi:hypothetical protein
MTCRARQYSAALVAVALAAAGGSAYGEEKDVTRAAEQAFAKGTELFKKRDYLGAIESFEEAYRLRPHFMVQCNIARCHEWSGGYVEAGEHYRRCLNEGARGTKEGERIETALKEAEGRITYLKVQSPGAGGTIYVDGRSAGPTPRIVPIDPGTRVVEVRRANATPATVTIKTHGGEHRTLTLAPVDLAQQRPEPATRPVHKRKRLRPVWFWVTAATTVALAVAATGLGIATLKARDSFEEHPTEDDYQKAVDLRLATNVMWGLTAAAAGASTALFFYTDFKRAKHKDQDETVVSLGVGGRF